MIRSLGVYSGAVLAVALLAGCAALLIGCAASAPTEIVIGEAAAPGFDQQAEQATPSLLVATTVQAPDKVGSDTAGTDTAASSTESNSSIASDPESHSTASTSETVSSTNAPTTTQTTPATTAPSVTSSTGSSSVSSTDTPTTSVPTTTSSNTASPLPTDSTIYIPGRPPDLPDGALEGFVWPLPESISREFGYITHPVYGTKKLHAGIDIRAEEGTDIMAAGAGTVTYAGDQGGFGLTIVIIHAHGISTKYAHQSELLVAEGTVVEANTLIGRVGVTGVSTGPHLHLELQIDGAPYDPRLVLP